MKRLGIVGAFVVAAFLMAAFIIPNTLSVQAQETSVDSAWDIQAMPHGVLISFVKHNAVTGQTLILSCNGRCDRNEEWREYPVAE